MKLQAPDPNRKRDQPDGIATEPLWTVEDVAAYLRLKEETVRMMARTDKLPALKVGKVWRFRSTDIKNMLKSRVRLKK